MAVVQKCFRGKLSGANVPRMAAFPTTAHELEQALRANFEDTLRKQTDAVKRLAAAHERRIALTAELAEITREQERAYRDAAGVGIDEKMLAPFRPDAPAKRRAPRKARDHAAPVEQDSE